MSTEASGFGGSSPADPTSEVARLNLDIEQYEMLLGNSLGPTARTMFEHLLARARAELVLVEAEASAGRAWLAEVSGPR
jgi:hypothetical protein